MQNLQDSLKAIQVEKEALLVEYESFKEKHDRMLNEMHNDADKVISERNELAAETSTTIENLSERLQASEADQRKLFADYNQYKDNQNENLETIKKEVDRITEEKQTLIVEHTTMMASVVDQNARVVDELRIQLEHAQQQGIDPLNSLKSGGSDHDRTHTRTSGISCNLKKGALMSDVQLLKTNQDDPVVERLQLTQAQAPDTDSTRHAVNVDQLQRTIGELEAAKLDLASQLAASESGQADAQKHLRDAEAKQSESQSTSETKISGCH